MFIFIHKRHRPNSKATTYSRSREANSKHPLSDIANTLRVDRQLPLQLHGGRRSQHSKPKRVTPSIDRR